MGTIQSVLGYVEVELTSGIAGETSIIMPASPSVIPHAMPDACSCCMIPARNTSPPWQKMVPMR